MNSSNDTGYAQALEVALSALDVLCRQKLDAADAALIDPAIDLHESMRIVGESTGLTDAYLCVAGIINNYRREQYRAGAA